MDLISVIIPTYNRFSYVLNAIESVKNSTYKNIEIIVVNDCSTQPEYYTHNFEGCKILHLPKNSKQIFGFACGGYVRNEGVKISQGKYLAFLDDDDYFLPHKLEIQIQKMIENDSEFSSTEGYFGYGRFDSNKKYLLYNREHYWEYLSNKLNLKKDFPNTLTIELINIHNIIITSSVMMTRKLYDKVKGFDTVRNGEEDYGLWKKCLNECDGIYIKIPCMYYDGGHGDGQNY